VSFFSVLNRHVKKGRESWRGGQSPGECRKRISEKGKEEDEMEGRRQGVEKEKEQKMVEMTGYLSTVKGMPGPRDLLLLDGAKEKQ